MTKARKILLIVRVILLLSGLISIIYSVFLWQSKGKNHSITAVPKNAKFVLKVDGKSLFQKEIDGILNQNDNKSLELIQKIYRRRNRKIKNYTSPKRKKLGIDYLAHCYYFITEENVEGITFSIDNEEKFSTNIDAHIDSNSVGFTKGKVGIVLWSNELKKEKIQTVRKKIRTSNSHFDRKKFTSEKNIILQAVSNNTPSNNWFSQSSFSISHDENNLYFKGNVPTIQSNFKEITSNDFHIHTNEVSSETNKKIKAALSPLGIELPIIKKLSANYGGMKIEMKGKKVWFIPQADLLLQLKDNFDLQSELLKYEEEKNIQLLSSYRLKFREQNYFYQQVDSNTIYLGIRPLNYSKNETKNYFFAKGNPNLLTKIESSPIVMGLLGGIKEYVSFKELFKKINNISIEINHHSDQNLTGMIQFKKDTDAYIETIKFLMESGLIR